jgi:hypothetical protein
LLAVLGVFWTTLLPALPRIAELLADAPPTPAPVVRAAVARRPVMMPQAAAMAPVWRAAA